MQHGDSRPRGRLFFCFCLFVWLIAPWPWSLALLIFGANGHYTLQLSRKLANVVWSIQRAPNVLSERAGGGLKNL